jgi:hypothetical protein
MHGTARTAWDATGPRQAGVAMLPMSEFEYTGVTERAAAQAQEDA